MDPIVTSSIISGAASLFSGAGSAISGSNLNRKNRNWQEKMTKRQQQYQKDYSKYLADLEAEQNAEYWRKYNSPGAQRAAMEAAGINPFVAQGSQIQPVSFDSSAQGASAPGVPQPSNAYSENVFSSLAPGFQTALTTVLQNKQLDANIQLTNAQRAKTEAETISKQNENSLFPLLKATSEMEYLSKSYRTEVDRISALLAPYQGSLDLEESRAKIAEIWASEKSKLADAAKTDADRENQRLLTEATVPNIQADTALKQAQTSTEGVKRGNILADTALKRIEIGLTKPKLQQMLLDIGISETELSEKRLELLRNAINGGTRAKSLYDLVDKTAANIATTFNKKVPKAERALVEKYLREILESE